VLPQYPFILPWTKSGTMDISMWILGLMGLNLLLLGMLWIKVSSLARDSTNEKQAEMLKEDFNRQMAANRMEINQMVSSQFKTVFDTLRATSKDQNDSLKDFGLL